MNFRCDLRGFTDDDVMPPDPDFKKKPSAYSKVESAMPNAKCPAGFINSSAPCVSMAARWKKR